MLYDEADVVVTTGIELHWQARGFPVKRVIPSSCMSKGRARFATAGETLRQMMSLAR